VLKTFQGIESVGRQLRAAFDGHLTQIYQEGDDEIEVRVVLPDNEHYNYPMVPVCHFRRLCKSQRGEALNPYAMPSLAAILTAYVDKAVNNSNR